MSLAAAFAAAADAEAAAEIVRLGGRVYAVEPQQQSLEDRFLQLLEAEDAR